LHLKPHVGKKTGPYKEKLSDQRVAEFAKSVGAASGTVPPTLLTICRKGEFDLFQELKIPLSRVLHGEQEYSYETEIQPTDTLVYETTLAQAMEKQGSKTSMQIVILETRVQVERAGKLAPAALSKTTIVLR